MLSVDGLQVLVFGLAQRRLAKSDPFRLGVCGAVELDLHGIGVDRLEFGLVRLREGVREVGVFLGIENVVCEEVW